MREHCTLKRAGSGRAARAERKLTGLFPSVVVLGAALLGYVDIQLLIYGFIRFVAAPAGEPRTEITEQLANDDADILPPSSGRLPIAISLSV